MRIIIFALVLLLLQYSVPQTADSREYVSHRASATPDIVRSPKVDDARYFHPRWQFKRFRCRLPGYREVRSGYDRYNRGSAIKYRFTHWTDVRHAYHPCWKRITPRRRHR